LRITGVPFIQREELLGRAESQSCEFTIFFRALQKSTAVAVTKILGGASSRLVHVGRRDIMSAASNLA
jgi:hypothetical protein